MMKTTGLIYVAKSVLFVLLKDASLCVCSHIKKKFGKNQRKMLADAEWLKFLFFSCI